MLRRLAFLVVPLTLGALALPGNAATPPQIEDASGDQLIPQASFDIVSGLFTTTGQGKGKSYKPTKFVVSLTLAAPPSAGPGVTYEIGASTSTCGDVLFTYEPGTPYSAVVGVNGWADWGDCGDAVLLTPKVAGSTITWSFGMKQIAGMKVGTVFSGFVARVDPSNPVVPFPSNAIPGTGPGLIDKATGDGTWKLG